MIGWRLAGCLVELVDQVDAAAPLRSHASDGTIGDAAHAAEGAASGHNPQVYPDLGPVPVVTAVDITHDPAHGCDAGQLTEAIRRSQDPRVLYVIFDRREYSSYDHNGMPAWTWRPYTGTSDPHTSHLHLSCVTTAVADDRRPWTIGIGDLMSTSDSILAAWAAGLTTAPDGTHVEPVVWEQRREQWETQTTAALSTLNALVTTQQQTIDHLIQLLGAAGGCPDVAPLVAQIQQLTATEATLTALVTSLNARLAAAGRALGLPTS